MNSTELAHLYRAQVQRADMWRARLDSTTNWAVVCTAAALTVSFSEPPAGPLILAMTTLIITLFLWMEGRRYRYFELWSHRVRLIEAHYFAGTMEVEEVDNEERERWRRSLARSLRNPAFPISKREALGRRYRSVYIWLQLILSMTWMAHVWQFPHPVNEWSEFWSRSFLGEISVAWAFVVGVLFQATLFVFGVATMKLKDAQGEVFQKALAPSVGHDIMG